MVLLPLSEAVVGGCFTPVALIASDFDGTLTHQGKLTATVLESLQALAFVNIPVLIITGRSAGWVEAINSYLPIIGAIAENGGVFYRKNREQPEFLTPIVDIEAHRHRLRQVFQQLKTVFPNLKESADNRFRITDWTFDVTGLTPSDLQNLSQLCQESGWDFTYSTVQCHIKPFAQNKADSLIYVLTTYFPQLRREQVLTVGDSPNDESLFNPLLFPLSVGVNNILHYTDQIRYHPQYVTTKAENEGFCELATLILKLIDVLPPSS
ncbi:HAD-superfamily hydrolase, subfamily IIB [Gloeothece citriformis PCC 7424]|uniref:HAD-superfamily hydrolase, subfamily IIB n=1 Tax=Gloeothece citriformis (strain PCC 7424) TaxID=65393 RepID=B7K975_GLOC7|nr:HAD-IIB family hydrolase [Gloeothece citriformis]ACK68558.1 HAD-superfamily hydrolase, subfamily IIB [Gloeothece citriformis PCC 7424]